VILGYTQFYYAGDQVTESSFSVWALRGLALFYWTKTPGYELAPALDEKLRWLLFLIPAYVLIQCVPLPEVLVASLSPARWELLAAANSVAVPVTSATLSVVPAQTLAHFFRIIAYIVVFLLACDLARRNQGRQWVAVFPIVGLATAEASLGLLQYWAGEAGEIAQGTYVNRNHFAGLLEMVLPFPVMYAISILRLDDRREVSSLGPALKASTALMAASLLFIGITYSLSRMGFVTSLASLFLMGLVTAAGYVKPKKRFLVWTVLLVAVASCLVLLPPDRLIYRFADLSSAEGITAEGRLNLTEETLSVVAAYPLAGLGLGAYESGFQRYKISAPTLNDPYVHNDYLQLLAELGLVGAFLGGGLVILLFCRTCHRALDTTDPEARFLAIACFGSMTAILIHSLVDFNLYIPSNAMTLAWLSGVAASVAARPSGVEAARGTGLRKPATRKELNVYYE
jgi:O-antigen ligase